MENNTIARKKRKRIWPIEIIAGLFIMMIVLLIAVNVDIKTTQETLSDTAHYINEQCNSFTRHNLASETKSLMRVIESAQQINHNITYERRLSDKDIFTEEFIKKNMQECYLSAVIIMDSKGGLIAQQYTDGYGADALNEYLDSASLINVVEHPEKTYATRINVVCQMKVGLLLSIIILRQNMLIITTYHLHIYYQVMMTRKMERLLLQREIR